MTFCTLTVSFNQKKKNQKKKPHTTPKPSDCPSLMITNHLIYLVVWGGRGGATTANLFLSLASAPAVFLLLPVLFCVVSSLSVIVRYVWWAARHTCKSGAIPFMCILKQLLSKGSVFGHTHFYDWDLCISESVLCALILKFDETRFTNVIVSCLVFCFVLFFFFKGLKL